MAVIKGMIKGGRQIQELIYDCWYGNVNSMDGHFRLNSKLYFDRYGDYQYLTYMGTKIIEMQRGFGGWIQINSAGFGGKLLSSTDCNYIRGCGYDLKIKGGKVFFEGIDITDALRTKGSVRIDINRTGIISKKTIEANDLKKIKPLYRDIVEDFMSYVGGTNFTIMQQDKSGFTAIISAPGGHRFIEETAEEFSETYGIKMEAWDDQRGIGIELIY